MKAFIFFFSLVAVEEYIVQAFIDIDISVGPLHNTNIQVNNLYLAALFLFIASKIMHFRDMIVLTRVVKDLFQVSNEGYYRV